MDAMNNRKHQNVGNKLSDFKILKELGKGSYGTVYTVRSFLDDNVYVMKKMELNNLKEKQQKECYREVSILKKVSHHNIIKYYSSFLDGGILYIIMEYAESGDLYSLIKHYKRHSKLFEEFDIWRIGYEILNGLDYLHKNNIIHRDIKCLNLFITKDKHVKIGDLGVSTIVSSINALHCTRVGTPLYLSPELVKQIPYDFKVDIWSCGCSLYHLACLDPPFIGDNLIVLGNNIVKGKPKPLPSQYSENLSKFIDRMLSKRPEKRPTAREALELIPKDILEKIKLAKQNNIEIKTRPFSSVGNRVITYNKEETQNVELQPIKKKKKIKENNIVNQGNKNEVKQQFETKGNNNYSKKPQSLNTNIKANELSSILLDQKKPKPIEISIEEKIVDNSKEPKLSNSNVNIFRNKNHCKEKIISSNIQQPINELPLASTKTNNKSIKIYEKEKPKVSLIQIQQKEKNSIEKVDNFILNEDVFNKKHSHASKNNISSNNLSHRQVNNQASKRNDDEGKNILKFPELSTPKIEISTGQNIQEQLGGFKRILSSQCPRNHTPSISNRPFTASTNRVLPPHVKSRTSRPMTASQMNRNNVINININFYNIDMNKRFLNPNSNPLELNQYNPDISLLNSLPQTNKLNINSLLNQKNINNDFIFDKIIKTIERSRTNKPLTIKDFGNFK